MIDRERPEPRGIAPVHARVRGEQRERRATSPPPGPEVIVRLPAGVESPSTRLPAWPLPT